MSHLNSNNLGVDLQKLVGQQNYLSWSRDFKIVAQSKNVWKLLTGSEEILQKPDRSEYFASNRQATIVTRSEAKKQKEKGEKEKAEAGDGDYGESNELRMRMQEYTLDLAEYDRQDQRVRDAISLICYWVDPAIRGNLLSLDNPKEVWDWLASQYKMTDNRAQDLALSKMEKLTMANCSSAQEFINKIEMYRLDLKDVGAEYTQAQAVSKIMRSLTPQYEPFVDQYHFLQDTMGLATTTLHGITSQLLTFESKLAERSKRQVSTLQSDANKNSKGKKDEKAVGPPCEECGRTGHAKDKCWFIYPDLKKAFYDKKKKKGNGENQATTAPTSVKAVLDTDGNTQNDNGEKKPSKISAMATVNVDVLNRLIGGSDMSGDKPTAAVTAHANQNSQDSLQESHSMDGEKDIENDQERPQNMVFSSLMMLMGDDEGAESRDVWIMDSGANAHLVNDVS